MNVSQMKKRNQRIRRISANQQDRQIRTGDHPGGGCASVVMVLFLGFFFCFFGVFVLWAIMLDIITVVALLGGTMELEHRMLFVTMLVPFNAAGIMCGVFSWLAFITGRHWLRKSNGRTPEAREPHMPSSETGRIAAVSFGWMWHVAFWIGATVWLVASASTAALYVESARTDQPFHELPAIVNALGLLGGAGAVVWLARRLWAMSILQLPELSGEPYPLLLGQHVTLQFFQGRKRPCEITNVTGHLTCNVDGAEYGSSRDDAVEGISSRVVLWDDELTFQVSTKEDSAKTITGTTKLHIPDDLPRSSNDAEWVLITRTHVAGWPPMRARFILEVERVEKHDGSNDCTERCCHD